METIYCNLDARRLTLCGGAEGRRASGGQDTVCYAFLPRQSRRAERGNNVIDFAAARQAITGQAMQPEAEEAAPAPRPERQSLSRCSRAALAAELVVTGAIFLLVAAVAVAFFTL